MFFNRGKTELTQGLSLKDLILRNSLIQNRLQKLPVRRTIGVFLVIGEDGVVVKGFEPKLVLLFLRS